MIDMAMGEAWPDAACRGRDTNLFFELDHPERAQARRLCGGCPRRVECLDRAQQRGDEHGIFGGVGPAVRLSLRRGRKRASCPACRSKEIGFIRPTIQACVACALSWRVGHISAAQQSAAVADIAA